jgi:hypothetical protein
MKYIQYTVTFLLKEYYNEVNIKKPKFSEILAIFLSIANSLLALKFIAMLATEHLFINEMIWQMLDNSYR